MRGNSLRHAVESLFQVVRERNAGDEIYFVCPEHDCGDVTGNRSVNLKSGKTFCWRCSKGGDFIKWARKLGYDTSDDQETFLCQEPLAEMDFSFKRDQRTLLPLIRAVKLPYGFRYCHENQHNVYTELIAEMARRKRLAIEDLFRARVGFTKVDPRWEPYAIFPVFEDNEPV